MNVIIPVRSSLANMPTYIHNMLLNYPAYMSSKSNMIIITYVCTIVVWLIIGIDLIWEFAP